MKRTHREERIELVGLPRHTGVDWTSLLPREVIVAICLIILGDNAVLEFQRKGGFAVLSRMRLVCTALDSAITEGVYGTRQSRVFWYPSFAATNLQYFTSLKNASFPRSDGLGPLTPQKLLLLPHLTGLCLHSPSMSELTQFTGLRSLELLKRTNDHHSINVVYCLTALTTLRRLSIPVTGDRVCDAILRLTSLETLAFTVGLFGFKEFSGSNLHQMSGLTCLELGELKAYHYYTGFDELTQLRKLKLSYCADISAVVQSMTSLCQLTLKHTAFTDESLATLDQMPRLDTLKLCGNNDIHGHGLRALTNLTCLCLRSERFRDSQLLSDQPDLTELTRENPRLFIDK